MELRADVVPKTAENFRALCTGAYISLSSLCLSLDVILQVGSFWEAMIDALS